MNDFMKQELVVGDVVVFMCPGHREMMLGHVQKINAQMITVKYFDQRGTKSTSSQNPSSVVKVEGPQVTMFLLKMKDFK